MATSQNLEQVLDLIAEKLITSEFVDQNIVTNNQKTIKNGILTLGRTNADKLILFEKDIKANREDLVSTFGTDAPEGGAFGMSLNDIVDNINFDSEQITISVGADGIIILSSSLTYGNGIEIQNLLSDGDNNPLNVSQFVNIIQETSLIDGVQANEFLDTTIYELLPDGLARQQRINNFFSEWQVLKGEIPLFDQDGDEWVDDDFSVEDYSAFHDISFAQTQPDDYTGGTIEESESFITRLDESSNEQNSGKTMQSLRTQLNQYLVDIDEVPAPGDDQRPKYKNKSEGYLKFRHLNQGIIIRNVNQEFIDGINPDKLEYLETGFTLTMWVRFLDKTSEGTLFNFGNPLRQLKPFGFTLDTFVLQKNRCDNRKYQFPENDYSAVTGPENPNGTLFGEGESERFVRLIVREGGADDYGILRDTHVGSPYYARRQGIPMQGWDNTNHCSSTLEEDTSIAPNQINVLGVGDGQFENSLGLFNHVRIPTSLEEWYFIVATFNPNIVEDDSFEQQQCDGPCNMSPDFWRGNITGDSQGYYTHHSGYGAKCKVEIISRSDLLRARGYGV